MRVQSWLMRERRKVPRHVFGATGTLSPAGGGAGTNVVVLEISTLGCEIEAAEGPNVGKKCELYINWRGTQIGVQARVVWKSAEGRMGLMFFSVDKESKKRLSDLCASVRIRPLSAPLQQEAGAARSVQDSATVRQLARAETLSATAPLPPPRPVRASARRRVPRYISELPVRLSNPVTGETSNASLVSVSILGGCLQGPGLPSTGQKCELNAEWEGKLLRIQGEIVWNNQKERAGINFASLDEGAEKLLRQICASLRLEPLAPTPL